MSLREEELVSLFTAIEALIDEHIELAFGRDSLIEHIRASELKQDCINLIAFGEAPPDEDK